MSDRVKFFGNVATTDTWKVSKIARMFTKLQGQGYTTMIWMNLYGAKVTDSTQSFDLCPVTGKDIHSVLKDYIAAGGDLMLGDECMNVEGIQKENVLPGTKFVNPPNILSQLTDPTMKVLTYS